MYNLGVAFENEYNYQAAASLKSVEQAVHEKGRDSAALEVLASK